MPVFEVFIPASTPEGFDVTARVQADTWMAALRSGLAKLGVEQVRNVFCDITEAGIEVTEPGSGRVFRILELGGASGQAAAPPVAPPRAPTPPPPAPAPAVATPAPARPLAMAGPPPPAARQSIKAAPPPAARRPSAEPKAPPAKPTPAAVEMDERRSRPAAGEARIGRTQELRAQVDALSELFDLVQGVYRYPKLADAAGFLLDLAMKVVPCESGSVFLSDINRQDLGFVAARGPKASEVLSFRVPMGQGIVGFAAQEDVAIVVSDAHRDPRFFAEISNALGYDTRSLAAAPASKDGRTYGAVELINHKGGSSFSTREVDLLNYIALAFADYLISTGQTGD
jgi:hypothetical protein